MSVLIRFLTLSLLFVSAFAVHARGGLHRRAAALTGDSKCGKYVCVSAVSNGTLTQYVMQSNGLAVTNGLTKQTTWISIGFGTTMANSQMVIMWHNADGSVTLSQRTTKDHNMPTVSTPTRQATTLDALTTTTGSKPKFAFTMPANSDKSQKIIWAIGGSQPSSSAEDATIPMHVDGGFGTLTLDLTKIIKSPASSSAAGASGGSSATGKSKQTTATGTPTKTTLSGSATSTSTPGVRSAGQISSSKPFGSFALVSSAIGSIVICRFLAVFIGA